MAGKLISDSVGACGLRPRRGLADPAARRGPLVEKARLYWPPEITRTEAMARIGEIGRETAQHLALDDRRARDSRRQGRSRRRAPSPRAASGRPPRRCGYRRGTPPCARPEPDRARRRVAPSGGRERSRDKRSRRRLASSSARVDAGELLVGHDVAGEPRLDLGETRVVGVLEGLEGAGEIVERRGDVAGGGFGLEG